MNAASDAFIVLRERPRHSFRGGIARHAKRAPFLSHPPFGLLSLHGSSILCEWKSSAPTDSGSTRPLSKK